MKETFRYATLALLLLGLSACAVLDISTLDSAVPLKAGQSRLSAHQTVGVDISSMTYVNYYLEDNSDFYATPVPVTGVKYSYGHNGKTDIGGSVWLSAFNFGGRIYLKHLLLKEGKTYIALVPGMTYVQIQEEYEDTFDRRHEAIGSEIQLLYTYQTGKSISFTTALRANYNRYTETVLKDVGMDEVYGPYDVVNVGVRGNMKLNMGPLVLIPEIGVECVPVVNGKLTFLPVTGFALGLEF